MKKSRGRKSRTARAGAGVGRARAGDAAPAGSPRARGPAAKLERLKKVIARCESALVAYSGGVDSTFLLAVAKEVLGPRLLAVTAASAVVQPSEIAAAKRIARGLGVKNEAIDTDEIMDLEEFCANSPERCYHCKQVLFARLTEVARERGLACVMEASNADDTGDYRPGLRAVKELAIKSPLIEADLTKADIRSLSREMGLPTWDKPSLACLASRFPYGERITVGKLGTVLKAEEYLLSLGFGSCRVRYYGKLARIEVPRPEIERLMEDRMRAKVVRRLKALGFQYVTIDLEGYRSGSMNVGLEKSRRRARG